MITKITEANQDLYYSLFEEINQLLGLNIDSIEEYFLNLNSVANYVNEHEDKTYFLRLPTDENLFEINANTRIINVPNHFKKNGLAVVGDSYAETVWFKIDKYFDIQDLGTNDIQIRIYWELPGTKIKGYSVPQFKDVWSEAGQVIFGWTIPSLLTETSGNLTFSVSFYDDGAVDYQFNTLPQTVKIQANPFSLRNDAEYTVDNTSRTSVLGRLKNSANSAIFVSPPVFSIFSPVSIGAEEVFMSEDDYCDLQVTAYSPLAAGAEIEYFWFKGGVEVSGGVDVYLETQGEYNNDKVYYASNEGGEPLDRETAQVYFANGDPVYEKGSKLRVNEVGNYQVKAIAKVSAENAEGQIVSSVSRPSYGSVWVFEKPDAIKGSDIKLEITQLGIIHGGDNDPMLKITYPVEKGQQQFASWAADVYMGEVQIGSTSSNEFGPLTEEGEYHVEVTKTLNNESLAPVVSNKVASQKAAIAASVINPIANQTIMLGSPAPALEYNYNGGEELAQSYEYIYYTKKKGDTTWKALEPKFTSEPNNYTPIATGMYAMIIRSIYKNDVAISKDPSALSEADVLFSVLTM